jgi:hypothetical protein
MGKTSRIPQEIACQQVLVEDASVFSIQWTVFPSSHASVLTPGYLVARYLSFLRSATLSLIRPVADADQVDFRLLQTKYALLSFTGPVFTDTGTTSAARLSICGGILVQPEECRRGELALIVETVAEGVKVILQLHDYCPLLLGSRTPSTVRKFLYRWTQAFIHRVVTVRFLASLWKELTGNGRKVRVVRVGVRTGEET